MPGGGNENTLAYDEKNGVVYKSNNLFNSQQSISKFLEGIENHNKLFPENKYELVGFTGHNIDGKPYVEPIVKQDYIPDATQATQKEIDAHMESMGMEKVNDHTFKNDEYTVSDLRPRNVLKDKDGNIHVVDDIVTKNQIQEQIPGEVDVRHEAENGEGVGTEDKKPETLSKDNPNTKITFGKNEYSVTLGKGGLEVTNAEGKEPSPQTKRKVLREYENKYDYS